MKINNQQYKYINHPYQIIEKSPWPFVVSMCLFMYMTLNGVFLSYGCLNFYSIWLFVFLYHYSFIGLILAVSFWWYDMIIESLVEGTYTNKVQLNLSIGMILFIISEVMFFFGFFWAYFHLSLNPSDELQGHWPPVSIETIFAYGLPLINTILLLSSGLSLTWSHVAFYKKNKDESILGLILTICLGLIFMYIQFMEFRLAKFTIADSAYGSIFFILTGLHGLHVIIGIIFLLIALIRLGFNHFNYTKFSGFELAIWYWHFVDIVWLFVFTFVYIWGNE